MPDTAVQVITCWEWGKCRNIFSQQSRQQYLPESLHNSGVMNPYNLSKLYQEIEDPITHLTHIPREQTPLECVSISSSGSKEEHGGDELILEEAVIQ